jgi:hypothetical protein
MRSARFVDILELLSAHKVEFIVVGMTAGILGGVPVTTLDLDVVHRLTPENVDRLLRALVEIRAEFRHDPRKLTPNASHLISRGHQLLTTTYGDLDCLGTIDGGKAFEDLLSSTTEIMLSSGATVRILDLPALLEIKRRAGRPKDQAVIPLLEATIAERTR